MQVLSSQVIRTIAHSISSTEMQIMACLVLQLLKWKAKVMLHANGRGDMWWTSVDISKMCEAYRELVDVIQAQQTTADAPRTDSQEGDQHGD